MPEPPIYEFDAFRIDSGRRLLLQGGEPVPLKPRVFDTLLYLVSNQGRVLEKDDLMRAIWPDAVVEENNLNQNISALRRALGESRGENRYIVTVPGRGYQFAANVKTVWGAPAARPRRMPLLALLALLGVVAVIGLGIAFWPRPHPAQVRKMAVLPFKPLTSGNRDESLEVGMADTLIAKLSNVRDITVRPLSAVRKYGGPEQDAVAAGRALGVDAVLDGQIYKLGDRIRVTTRLVRVSDEKQLWAGQFDEQLTDIFAVQDSISEKVTSELSIQLTGEERELLAKRYTNNAQAYELYLRGRFFYSQSTLPAILKGIGFLQEAIQKDPTYALAYAGLADCYDRLPITSDVPPREAFPKARQAAVRSLELDPRLVEARTVLGWIDLWHEWDWKAAETEFRRAMDVNPNYTFARLGYAHLLSDLGRKEEALHEANRALEIEPISVYAGMIKGHVLYQARRYPEAIDALRRTLELDPNYWVAQITLGKSYERSGRYEEALDAFRKARELSGGSSEPISLIGFTEARSGRKDAGEAALRELKKLSTTRYVPAYNIALVYLGLGNSSEAIRWLDKAYEENDVHMVFLGADPKWDSLRSDPAFVRLLRRLHF